jgi:DNA-binding LacI/PurR family transcriptional regulator
MLANIPNGDRVPPFLRTKDVGGIILKGPNQGLLPSATENELLRHVYAFPFVWLMGRLPNAHGDHCNFDTEIAGRLATEHLFEQGHRHVGFIDPKPGQSQFERLKRSFCDHVSLLGGASRVFESERPKMPSWPLPAVTDERKVRDLVGEWRALPAAIRPTALFAPSDRTAVQIYSALEQLGLRVPQDVSLISCNNEMSVVMGLRPGLTTIDIHAEVIGRRTVDQLRWRIEQTAHNFPCTQVLVEPVLVVRESVGKI